MQAGFIMQHRREYKKPLVFWSTVAFILGLIIMVNAQLSMMQGSDSKLLSSVNPEGASDFFTTRGAHSLNSKLKQ